MSTANADDEWPPPEIKARIESELATDEKLVWVGRPRADLLMKKALPAVIIGAIFVGFAIFWMAGAANMGAGGFALFGLVFVAVGTLIMLSPLWVRRNARRTCYALTDRRAILWEPSFSGVRVFSYSAAGLGKLFRVDRRDGAGDLVFEEYVTTSTNSEGQVTRTTHQRGFLAIDGVRDVEDLLRKTLLAK